MATFASLGGRPCLDPGDLAKSLASGSSPLPTDWASLANRYACPIGLAPGRGHALLRRSDLDALATLGTLKGKLAFKLSESNFGTSAPFPNLRIVGHPRCLDFGAPDPAYLVELADKRIDLVHVATSRHQWRYASYDWRAAPGTRTIDSWSAACQALWEFMPTLGAWPGLPADVPSPNAAVLDRLDWHGARAVDCLEDALAAVGCGAVYDPIRDTFSIIYFPTAQDTWEAIRKRYVLIYDERPYIGTVGPVPAQVVVQFPTWYPGRSDRDPRRLYGVAFPLPAVNLGSGIVPSAHIAYLQDYTVCRLFANGDLPEDNKTALAERAAQVGRIFYDRFTTGAARQPLRQAFSGLINDPLVRPGSNYDLVSWGCTIDGPTTSVGRAGMIGTTEMYVAPALTGLMTGTVFDSKVIAKDQNNVPIRAGGLPPGFERGLESIGQEAERKWISVAGAGLGPFFERTSALRQGDWFSAGSGGKTDRRSRLWRNWEDAGPDDMVRFVVVTGGVEDVTVIGDDFDGVVSGGSDITFSAHPAKVVRQEWSPDDGLVEENCYIVGANAEELETGRSYLSHAGPHADDGLRIWSTNCCEGGSLKSFSGGEPGDGDNPTDGGPDDSGGGLQSVPEYADGCNNCNGQPFPKRWKVTVSGSCSTISSIAGTYYIDYDSTDPNCSAAGGWYLNIASAGTSLNLSICCYPGILSGCPAGTGFGEFFSVKGVGICAGGGGAAYEYPTFANQITTNYSHDQGTFHIGIDLSSGLFVLDIRSGYR